MLKDVISNSASTSSLQITIKSSGLDKPFQSSNSSQPFSSAGGQQGDVAEKLANALTSLLFGTQGLGGGAQSRGLYGQNSGGLFGQNGFGGLSNNGSLLGSGLTAMDSGTQLAALLLNVLSQLLNGDTAQNGQNGLFGQKQPTNSEVSAYQQGVQDALSSILNNGFSQTSNEQQPLQLGSNGLQGLSGESAFNQLGNTLGLSVGQQAGLQELNNVSTHNDSPTRYFVDQEDRALAKEIGQFMDQYPEKFGKPEYQKDNQTSPTQDDKSWAQALSNPDDDGMTKASMDKFLEAVGMIKSAVAGDVGNANLHERGNGGSSLGIDAAMIGDRIINMGLEKQAA
ncbi:type III secretion protein HrpN [Brenneria izadpanahii]|uniref:Type III secretion protein HrpN n=1 Tax=Brenneria izadpanahii TaxID=2722756 RepID=A0ABX7UX71_9GAMM|nr:type III secretion protein HrpN [Brenneria izadpanahii]QTF08194.1 type III secretion protein HrpN [Brenneria izadpanahii]